MKPKILFYDLETTPNLAYVWGMWEQDVIAFKEEWKLLSFAAKWMDGKVFVKGTDEYSEKQLVKELWNLFNEADVIIAHNGDKFDRRKANAKFIQFGLKPPQPYQTIDTLKIARKHFAFNSNKLNALGITLGVGEKVKHTGFDLWLGCMRNDPKSWDLMKKYNKQDVLLLERVYIKLLAWIDNHPNVAILDDIPNGCPNCASRKLQRRGIGINRTSKYQRYQCLNCGSWSKGVSKKVTDIK